MITQDTYWPLSQKKTKKDRYKARYVAGGHLDIMKDYLVYGVQIIQCVSVRIILVIANVKGFRI